MGNLMKTDDFSDFYADENEACFRRRLLPDEYIQWSGAGKTPRRAPRLIASIILLTFFLVWTVIASFTGVIPAVLFGRVFVLMGISAVIKALQPLMPNRYALTDQRVLMQFEGGFEEVKLENIRSAEAARNKNDTGYVRIESERILQYGSRREETNYIFDINEPEYVCELILSERDKLAENR